MVDRHTIAQHAGNQLGIVPILRIELLRQSLDSRLVAALVLELEVIALGAVLVHLLDNLALGNGLGQHDTLLVVLQTCEYLIRIAIQQSNESHPLVFIVLEAHYVALQHLGTDLRHLRMLAGGIGLLLHVIVLGGVSHLVLTVLILLLVFLGHTDHHARTASITIDGTAFAT